MTKIVLLMLLSVITHAEVSIVMRGSWSAECNGVTVSTHNRYDKALESALNQNKNCSVIPPERFEVTVTEDTPLRGIELTWDLPTEREDGSQIEKIDRFNLYVYFNTVLQDIIEVAGTATVFQLSEIEAGNYSFQISTVEDGLEGARSEMIFQVIE